MRLTTNYICVLLLFILGACTKDDNNFSYEEAVDFQINDNIVDVIHIRQGDILELSPDFDDSKGDYSYLWFAWRNNSSIGYRGERDTLGTEKDLLAEIKPSYYILGEPYRLTFKVTDNRTGVSAFYFYDLLISNIYTEGWIVLEDRSGQADFSMILPDGEAIHNIYSSVNPTYPLNEPLMLSLSRGNVIDEVTATGRKFYLVGAKDAIDLDVLTMQKRFDFDFLFFQPPPVRELSYAGWSGTSLGVIVNEGLLLTNFVGGFPGAKKFGLYMQAPEVGYDYEMAPFVANIGPYTWNSNLVTHEHIMYDQKNKRFYKVSGQSISTLPTNASDLAIFDMNNVGQTMHYMAPSYIANSQNAIMREGSQAYLLQFKQLTTTGSPVITQLKQAVAAPYILETPASCIASSTQSPHLFYGHGASLYRYEISSNSSTEVFSFSGGEDIVNVKFRALGDGTGQLLVATWDNSESKIYDFSLSSTGGLTSSGNESVAGFSEIVDMVYKTAN